MTKFVTWKCAHTHKHTRTNAQLNCELKNTEFTSGRTNGCGYFKASKEHMKLKEESYKLHLIMFWFYVCLGVCLLVFLFVCLSIYMYACILISLYSCICLFVCFMLERPQRQGYIERLYEKKIYLYFTFTWKNPLTSFSIWLFYYICYGMFTNTKAILNKTILNAVYKFFLCSYRTFTHTSSHLCMP